MLLDEQKNLTEQPEGVQRALRTLFDSFTDEQLAAIKKERLAEVRPEEWKSKAHREVEWQIERQHKILAAPTEPKPEAQLGEFTQLGIIKL